MKKNNIINNWLTINGDQEIDRLVKRNLAISYKVREILSGRNLSDPGYIICSGR